MEEGLKVLNTIADRYDITWEFVEFPWGSDYYFEHGHMMPPDALDTLAEFDQIYLGAVGHPDIQDHLTLNGLLLPIRRRFDQYVCERPSVLYPGINAPLKDKDAWDIDLVVIRENTEGEYANVGGFSTKGFPKKSACRSAYSLATAASASSPTPSSKRGREIRSARSLRSPSRTRKVTA